MSFDRRTFIASVCALIPAAVPSRCAKASEREWPGQDTPAGELPKLPIGMNLSRISDWQPGYPFRNLMWGSRPWLTRDTVGYGAWDTEQAEFFEFDADGYPLEVPIHTAGSKGKLQEIFTLLPNQLKPGRYTLFYDGEGEFKAFLGTKILSQSPGRVELHMSHESRLVEGLVIAKSTRGNHVRNMRVLAEGDDPATLGANPFTAEFLDFCKNFHALRFMDWGAINGSMEEEWAHRKRATFYTMTPMMGDLDGIWVPKPNAFYRMYTGGVAYEIMIKLANLLEIDPWICIPHRASDDYIRQCAAFFRENLDPARKLYVEYSNELWNWQFDQASWMLRSEYAAGVIEREGIPAWKTKADGKREGVAHPERIGALFTRAYKIWLGEWAGPARERVTTVCAVQAHWVDASVRTIDWCARDGLIDAVAPAAYFAPWDEHLAEWDRRGAALTGDEVIKSMQKVVAAESGKNSDLFEIASHAKGLGLTFLNYEGGQHILPRGDSKNCPYLPALAAAQTHPGMYALYVETLRQQRHLGSKLFCAYNSIGPQYSDSGAWGSKPSYATPASQAPKFKALIDCNTPTHP